MEGRASGEYQCHLVEAAKRLSAWGSRRGDDQEVKNREENEDADCRGMSLLLGNLSEIDLKGMRAVVKDSHVLQERCVL